MPDEKKDINLLPEDLRKEKEKELLRARERSLPSRVTFTSPEPALPKRSLGLGLKAIRPRFQKVTPSAEVPASPVIPKAALPSFAEAHEKVPNAKTRPLRPKEARAPVVTLVVPTEKDVRKAKPPTPFLTKPERVVVQPVEREKVSFLSRLFPPRPPGSKARTAKPQAIPPVTILPKKDEPRKPPTRGTSWWSRLITPAIRTQPTIPRGALPRKGRAGRKEQGEPGKLTIILPPPTPASVSTKKTIALEEPAVASPPPRKVQERAKLSRGISRPPWTKRSLLEWLKHLFARKVPSGLPKVKGRISLIPKLPDEEKGALSQRATISLPTPLGSPRPPQMETITLPGSTTVKEHEQASPPPRRVRRISLSGPTIPTILASLAIAGFLASLNWLSLNEAGELAVSRVLLREEIEKIEATLPDVELRAAPYETSAVRSIIANKLLDTHPSPSAALPPLLALASPYATVRAIDWVPGKSFSVAGEVPDFESLTRLEASLAKGAPGAPRLTLTQLERTASNSLAFSFILTFKESL